jgi:hypothetical protein
MTKRNSLVALVGLAAMLSMASLLTAVRHALTRREKAPPEPDLDPREAERRRIREALGDMLAPPIDLNDWPERFRPRPGLPDRDTLRRSLPRSNRPAWHDIREERESGW